MPNDSSQRPGGTAAERRWLSDQLMDAVRAEQRLLDELAVLLMQQRAAIASGDHQALDDATFGIQRVTQTLGEATRRPQIINRQLGSAGNLPFAELIDVLALPQGPQLLAARANVRDAARSLEEELRANRAMLEDALQKQA